MTKVRDFYDNKSHMQVEVVYHAGVPLYVVHIVRGASIALMRRVYDEYKNHHLLAVVPEGSRINTIAGKFGMLVETALGNNIYHIHGD